MYILAIETSCDETAAAIVDNNGKVLSNIVASQVEDHAAFGGVVPEIASRRHIELIQPVVNQAFREADVTLSDLGGIAVTQGPGLVGALLVGVSFAKALAYGLDIPIRGVNHLEGHLSAACIEHDVSYPHIGAVVSGGHTSIYKVNVPGGIIQIGQTKDDAAGEAFDKVAKLLGLGYPGGVLIDRIAQDVDYTGIDLPRPMISDNSYDFSFSGLKTAVLNLVIKLKIFPDLDLSFSGLPKKRRALPGKEVLIPKIAAAFQDAVIDVIIAKLVRAIKDYNMGLLVVTGGVASNNSLRDCLKETTDKLGIQLIIPDKKYCTDNAAMIGIASIRQFKDKDGKNAYLNMNAISRWRWL
ncbi:MAG: tRNA (adenosine(37)-N6)-threonylcarbamoyltransferase complex transferase subunit TsaD [Deltaproteobacteria bacterium]|nr:tRNA (adenosine(37)-N6)-threonylcarbamoyltransferase complex transferase subunit TsaD [Deltaproteobacteria bacterium]